VKVKEVVITSFAKMLLGGRAFSQIKGAVEAWANHELSGAQKRQAVKGYLSTMLAEMADWAVNLGIELAVAALKAKAGE
jgi:hypothetical protein